MAELYRKAIQFIITNEHSELLILNPYGWKSNEWKFPSGGVEDGEEPEDTLLREIYEELGIVDFQLVSFAENTSKYLWDEKARKKYDNKYVGQELDSFLVKIDKDSKIILQKEEIQSYKWIKKEELEKYFILENQLDSSLKTLTRLEFE